MQNTDFRTPFGNKPIKADAYQIAYIPDILSEELDPVSTYMRYNPSTFLLEYYNPNTTSWESISSGGAGMGDMLKSVYDTNNDGVVDYSKVTAEVDGIPGNNEYYGTNGSGVKGFYALPSGVGDMIKAVYDTNDDGTVDSADVATDIAGAPGVTKYYGTDGIGVKGFYDLPSGLGDVVGPASATDSALAVYDTTTGKLLKDSLITIDVNGYLNIPDRVIHTGDDDTYLEFTDNGVKIKAGGSTIISSSPTVASIGSVADISYVNLLASTEVITTIGANVMGRFSASGFELNATGPVIANFIDDDTFATATSTNVPTAESVKAYADSVIGGVFAGAMARPLTKSITPSTIDVIDFENSEQYDTDSFHDTVTNPSRMTIPVGKAGYYNIKTSLYVITTGSGFIQASITVNGSTVLTSLISENITTDGEYVFNGDVVLPLSEGDYVEVQFQHSCTTLSLRGSSSTNATFFSIAKQ